MVCEAFLLAKAMPSPSPSHVVTVYGVFPNKTLHAFFLFLRPPLPLGTSDFPAELYHFSVEFS